MIISASYKTDIPAFYGSWLMNRLEAGFCKIVNPYGGQVYTVSLTNDDVDGFVFWTRNVEPFLSHLDSIASRGFPFTVHHTITGYPKALDFATVAPKKAVDNMAVVRARFGPHAGVWRYDPIVFSSVTPPGWHLDNFRMLAQALSGTVDEVAVSFAHIYRKTARNMAAAARAFNFTWGDETDQVKKEVLLTLGEIARQNGIKPTLCGQPHLLVTELDATACVDAARLSRMAGYPVAAKRKPHRKECGCFQSKDIGAYDTCPHGCAYCYAVQQRSVAKRRFKTHDPKGVFLFERAD